MKDLSVKARAGHDKDGGHELGIEIIGAESLGVRSLCCRVTLPGRCIIIDPGVALGYLRAGLMPHPLQIAVGREIRERILRALEGATDMVFSHFHGDHVPLLDANPYQLALRSLPDSVRHLRCWSKSGDGLSTRMRKRFEDLTDFLGAGMQMAEGRSADELAFSKSVPHGAADGNMGSVMMTRIAVGKRIFVHASDIQLLDEAAVDQVINWHPDIVLAAGPPLYLGRLSTAARETAWKNALRLVRHIEIVILDHHLMRSEEGAAWLEALSVSSGRKTYCAADFMKLPRQLLEAQRAELYRKMPVLPGWHDTVLQKASL